MSNVEDLPLSNLSGTNGQPVASLAVAIWGPAPQSVYANPEDRDKALQWYLRYCHGEQTFILRRHPMLLERISLKDVIQDLKRNSQDTKATILKVLCNDQSNLQFYHSQQVLLDLAVRITFASGCVSVSQDTFGTGLFCPRWNENETLEAFINRVLPRDRPAPASTMSIRTNKLSFGYLTTYAKVNIAWIHLLTDHLLLIKRANTKTLHVFRHPSFLRASLEVLEENSPGLKHSTAEALALGCLPPQLLRETMETYNLLLPDPGGELSHNVLRKEMAAAQRKRDSLGRPDSLDESFLHPLPQYGYHEHPEDAADVEDVRTLYQKYPYWADRLYSLWREADDPTPTTLVERWSESRKNPRFTYWCTAISLTVAVSFGFVATLLSAMQVWLSYCAWVDDPSRPFCNKGSGPKNLSQGVV